MTPDLSNMPAPLLVFCTALVLIQLTLQVIAVVVLVKVPKGSVAGVPKIGWGAIILLGQMIGSVVFLILQRKDAKERSEQNAFSAQESVRQSESIRGTIDQLYLENHD